MRSPLLLTTTALLLLTPLTCAEPVLGADIHPRGVKRVTTVPAEYKAASGNTHVVSKGVNRPKMGTLRDGDHHTQDPTTRSLHSSSHSQLEKIKRSLLALLVGSAVQDPSVSSSQSRSRRSAMPVLALPSEAETEGREGRVKRGLVQMLVGGAVGDPNVSGSGAGGKEKRAQQEKRWIWDSVIIQDGDTRTDLPPPGSNVNYFSNSAPAQTPTGTPAPPIISNPFPSPSTPTPNASAGKLKPARISPSPSPSPSPTTTTAAEQGEAEAEGEAGAHTTAKARKMWNDPQLASKKAANLVGAAAAPTPAEQPAEVEIKIAAAEVEHDPHKFARPSPSPSPSPASSASAAANPDLKKRVYRGPILQDSDSIGTEEIAIQGGAETPSGTPGQPSLTSVEVEVPRATRVAVAQGEEKEEEKEEEEEQSLASAFVEDLLGVIGDAVGGGQGSAKGADESQAVEKRAVRAHQARGLTHQAHSPRLGLGAAQPKMRMRVKRRV